MISTYSSVYGVGRDDLFALHTDPDLFTVLTPPGRAVVTRGHTDGIHPGSVMEMRVTHPLLLRSGITLGGAPLGLPWRVRHTYLHAPVRFDDVQMFGPFARWHHTHHFVEVDEGTQIIDRVDWELPVLLKPLRPLVATMIDDLFAYRIAALNSYLTST